MVVAFVGLGCFCAQIELDGAGVRVRMQVRMGISTARGILLLPRLAFRRRSFHSIVFGGPSCQQGVDRLCQNGWMLLIQRTYFSVYA